MMLTERQQPADGGRRRPRGTDTAGPSDGEYIAAVRAPQRVSAGVQSAEAENGGSWLHLSLARPLRLAEQFFPSSRGFAFYIRVYVFGLLLYSLW